MSTKSKDVKEPLILTFDVGTQSSRVVLVDSKGNIIDKVKENYKEPYYSKYPNWAERDPINYWKHMCKCCQKLKANNKDIWKNIIAVTCTCIRATSVLLDKNGEPVRDAIVWLDKRIATRLPDIPVKSKAIFKIAGLSDAMETIRKSFHVNWLAIHEPENLEKTYKYGLLSTYFNVKFCGSMKDSYANMCGVLPYDTKTRKWIPKNNFRRCLYLIDDDKLVDLVEPGTILGPITHKAAEETGAPEGVPFIVTGSDKMCETFGLSVTHNNQAAISLGTLTGIQVPSEKFFNVNKIVPPFPSLTGSYLNEMQTYRGYWLVSWFKENFAQKEIAEAKKLGTCAEELLDNQLHTVPPGCDGLMMQPTLTPDAITPHARGTFVGITDVHKRMHFFRAIIEGITFTLYDGLLTLEKTGKTHVDKIFIAGGGSVNDDICQINANILGRPVCRIQTEEACGLGSSILAFITMKVYPDVDTAMENMVRVKDCFRPDEKTHELYDRMYREVYKRIFRKNYKIYRNIDRIFIRH